MVRPRKLMLVASAAAVAVAVVRRGRHGARGHQVPGGILIGHAGVYDALSRLLLGPFLRRIAADVAASGPTAPGSWRSAAAPASCRPG